MPRCIYIYIHIFMVYMRIWYLHRYIIEVYIDIFQFTDIHRPNCDCKIMHVSTGTTSPRMIVQLDLYLHLYTSWASINSDCKLVIPSIGTSFTGTVDPQPVFFCSRKKGGCPFKPSHGLCLWPIVVGLVPFGGLLSFYFSAPLCWFSPGAFGTPGTNLFFLKDVCVWEGCTFLVIVQTSLGV